MSKKIEDILAGYDTFEDSFETVDVPDVDHQPNEELEPVRDDALHDAVMRIEKQLDSIHGHLNGVTPEYQRDMKALEGLILPLLIKLSKGTESYIKWPNRHDQVMLQMERVLAITRKYVTDDA
jgi:hypothetical protein